MLRLRSASLSQTWQRLTDPLRGLPERLEDSSRISDFLLFVAIGLNGGLMVGPTTVGEIAAIPIVVLALFRRPERGWAPLGGSGLLVVVLGGWFLLSAVLAGTFPITRLGHVALYCALILVIGSGRVDVPAALRGSVVGLIIAGIQGVVTWGAGTYSGRLTGWLGDPNAAGYYVLVLGLCYLSIEHRRRRRIVIAAILLVLIVLTLSRTTLLGLGLVGLWVFLPARVPLSAKSALVFVLFTRISSIAESMKTTGVFAERGGSDELREQILPLEQALVARRPMIGHGPGTLTVTLDGDNWFFHSSYLLLRAEGGWILFVIMMAVIAAVAWRLAHPVSGLHNKVLEGAILGTMVCAINLGNVFLDYPLAVALGAALWWASAPRSEQHLDSLPIPMSSASERQA